MVIYSVSIVVGNEHVNRMYSVSILSRTEHVFLEELCGNVVIYSVSIISRTSSCIVFKLDLSSTSKVAHPR